VVYFVAGDAAFWLLAVLAVSGAAGCAGCVRNANREPECWSGALGALEADKRNKDIDIAAGKLLNSIDAFLWCKLCKSKAKLFQS